MSGLQKGLIMSASGFISRAACHGRRPSQFSSLVAHKRPALVAKLAKNRNVARFIVAPSGYGKSALVVEYAETMHSWSHVFWFNAQSPCFVRDLDAGVLADSLLSLDADAGLVVFDDIPLFDPERQESLSSEIDKLLERGCEVIVTCVPTCNVAGSLQRDRLSMQAESLLLDDAEIDSLRSADEQSRCPAEEIGPAMRVPLLAWSSESNCTELFAKKALCEETPADMLLAMSSMLVLREGSVADLASLGSFDATALEEVLGDYPHLGFNAASERFDATSLEMPALANPLKRCLPRLADRSRFDSPDSLVKAWAAILLKNRQGPRACALIGQVCSRGGRLEWAVDNAVELVRGACFFPTLQLVTNRSGAREEVRMRLDALEALCRRVLGDEKGALRCAKRSAFNPAAPEGARMVCLLITARLDSGAASEHARKELATLVEACRPTGKEACSIWVSLAQAWHASMTGLPDLSRHWLRLFEAGTADEALCVCTSWLFGLHGGPDAKIDPDVSLACRRSERYIRDRLAACETYNDADYFTASAGLSMEEAHARGMAFDGGPLDASSLMLLRQVEMGVLAQRRRFEQETRHAQALRSDWVATHPASLLNREAVAPTIVAERSVPLLSLRMFGIFEVSIGDVPVEYSLFKRQNTRALLVLLAVNQGRELSRDTVAEAMWPQSSYKVAHKNFYTVWAHLRRALSLPDGTCPYLIRHRYGCSLDARFVRSDVERLDEICREFLFSVPNIEQWSLLFAEVDRSFSSDLMPSERKNALIVRARDDYRSRLVDALVAATIGAIDVDNPQWGVWFARAAIARDETREDAYIALMRAQIAGNQRTAAMMTYLSCRRALSKHLGIDPSPETKALYESLLDSQ